MRCPHYWSCHWWYKSSNILVTHLQFTSHQEGIVRLSALNLDKELFLQLKSTLDAFWVELVHFLTPPINKLSRKLCISKLICFPLSILSYQRTLGITKLVWQPDFLGEGHVVIIVISLIGSWGSDFIIAVPPSERD